MINAITVNHVTYSSDTSFEAFTSALESQLGHHDISAYQRQLKNPKEAKDVEKILHAQEGSSGFMLFSTYDHGALLAIKGAPQKARQYVIGNPLFAARMTEHDIRAALYAPLGFLSMPTRQEKLASSMTFRRASSVSSKMKKLRKWRGNLIKSWR